MINSNTNIDPVHSHPLRQFLRAKSRMMRNTTQQICPLAAKDYSRSIRDSKPSLETTFSNRTESQRFLIEYDIKEKTNEKCE